MEGARLCDRVAVVTDRWLGLVVVLSLALLLWLAGEKSYGDTVTVTYTPATTTTDGSLLTADAWTVARQLAGPCPGGVQLAGAGRWNYVGPFALQFEQAKGSCACYELRTVDLLAPPLARISAPATVEHCVAAATCSGCHA